MDDANDGNGMLRIVWLWWWMRCDDDGLMVNSLMEPRDGWIDGLMD